MKKLFVLASLTILFFNTFAVHAQGSEPTQTPTPDTSQICVSVYNDTDGNGTLDTGESLARGARVEIFDISNKRIAWFTTDGVSEPNCTNVETGNYRIQVKAPEGYRATTRLDWKLDVPKDRTANLEFGITSLSAPNDIASSTQSVSNNTLIPNNVIALTIFVFLIVSSFLSGYAFKSRLTSTHKSIRRNLEIANVLLLPLSFVLMTILVTLGNLGTKTNSVVIIVFYFIIIICLASEAILAIYDRYRANYSRIKKILGISNLVFFIFIITVMPLLWGLGYVRANATADVSLGVGAGCILFEIGWAIHNKFFKDKINKPPQSWL